MSNNAMFYNKLTYVCFGFFLFLFILINSIFIVEESEQAILIQFGKIVSKEVFYSGFHIKKPFIQKVVFFDRRVLNVSLQEKEIISSDQKRFLVDSFVLYKIENPALFLQSVRFEANFDKKAAAIVESIIRQEVANVSLNCFLSSCRDSVLYKVNKIVSDKLKQFGVRLIDVQVKRILLPHENRNSIFERMISERKKEAAQIRSFGQEEALEIKSNADKIVRTIISEADAESKIIIGNAEAEAFNLYADAFKKDEDFFYFYYKIMFYKNAFDSDSTKIVLDSKSELVSSLLNFD